MSCISYEILVGHQFHLKSGNLTNDLFSGIPTILLNLTRTERTEKQTRLLKNKNSCYRNHVKCV